MRQLINNQFLTKILKKNKKLKKYWLKKLKKYWLPIVAFAASVAFFIDIFIETPVFQEPKYQYVNRETFMEYLEKDMIYNLPGIYECIINESNDWMARSLIELVEVKLISGIANNTYINFDVYKSSGLTEDGYCMMLIQIPQKPSFEEEINLKTFEEGRTIFLPLSITAPFYDEKSSEKIFDSDELNEKEKIIIQYLPRNIKYNNGKWQNIPILNIIPFKIKFTGMKFSKPILQ